jgi:replicative DNA helicase
MDSSKAVPHNLEVERALLGSVLLDNSALDLALQTVKTDDFYSQGHRLIFDKMLWISQRNRTVDLVTLSEELNKDSLIEKAGGVVYLAALTDSVPIGTSVAVSEYSRIVKEKSTLRRIINASNNIISRCIEETDDPAVLLDVAQAQLFDIAEQRESYRSFRDASLSLVRKLQEKELPAVQTGIKGIDDRTGGFLPEELIVYSAKEGVGKTLLAQQTRRWACKHGMHSLFASCEMPDEQLAGREIAGPAGVPRLHLRKPELLTAENYAKLYNAAQSQCPDCSILHGVLTIAQIAGSARRMKAAGKLSLLIVDYDELVSAPGKNELERLSYVATGAWQMAVNLKVPVILISQMRKSNEGSEVEGGVLDALYGSGAKKKHASTVVYIHRDFKSPWTGDRADLQQASIGVAKDRFGDVGWSDVWFSKSKLEFLNSTAS